LTVRWTGVPALLLFAAVALAPPAGVQAHARYASSEPGIGEVLQTPPTEVVIEFTQDLQKIAGRYDIQVTSAVPSPVTAGPAVIDDTDRSRMSVPLQPGLAVGRYVVRWANVSDEDGDPSEGGFSFYVGREPTADELHQDGELAQIGATDEPTPVTSTPAAAATPESPTPVDGDGASDDDDGDGATTAIVIGAAAAAAAVAAAGAFAWMRTRRTG
jgi:methionine-rich copper-binding protein CopC